MKDYSLNNIEREAFILNYEIINDMIKINYANNESTLIPYSIENEKKLLSRMKSQVLNAEKFANMQKFELDITCHKSLSLPFLLAISCGFTATPVGCLANILIGVLAAWYAHDIVNYRKILNDLAKNKSFATAESVINKILKSEFRYDVLKGLTQEKVAYLDELLFNNRELSLNDMDFFELKDIVTILNNVYVLKLGEYLGGIIEKDEELLLTKK